MSFPIRAGSAPGLTSERPDKLISTSPLLVHWALYQGKPCRDLATVRGARRAAALFAQHWAESR